jgi:hypothetical protein
MDGRLGQGGPRTPGWVDSPKSMRAHRFGAAVSGGTMACFIPRPSMRWRHERLGWAEIDGARMIISVFSVQIAEPLALLAND